MTGGEYTHGHHPSVFRSHSWRTVANSAAYLRDRLTPDAGVLDVGCGPGTITVEIATLVAPGRVIGIDDAEEALERARGAADGVGNVDFRAGDVYALDFADASFDASMLTRSCSTSRSRSRRCGRWHESAAPGE